MKKTYKKILVLHNIRSVQNVGAMFRTANGVGVDQIILSGYTPTPLDRFGRPRSDFAKTALGAEHTIPWVYYKTISSVFKKLRADGYTTVAVELSELSIDYKTYIPQSDTALLMGNEVKGISKQILQKCDVVIELPMNGSKESLNVSVTAGIVMYRLFDR